MNHDHLATYLNDHLAGSVAALCLLDHMVETTKGTEHEAFFQTLRADIDADQEVLCKILESVSAEQSTLRKAGGWLAEKAVRAKAALEGSSGAPMERLQALEGLLVGITGKRALWLTLSACIGPWEAVDFPLLVRRAEQQLEAVETKRMEAAREAMG